MKTFPHIPLVLLMMIFSFACKNKNEKFESNPEANSISLSPSLYVQNIDVDERNKVKSPHSNLMVLESKMGKQAMMLQELMLTISGNVNFESKDILKTTRIIEHAIFNLKGYIAINELENDYQKTEKEVIVGDSVIIRKHYKRVSNLSIHIPIVHFDSLMQTIAQEALFIDKRNLSATVQKIQFMRSQKSETQLIRWLNFLKEMNLKSPIVASTEKSSAELLRDEISNADDAAIAVEEIKQKFDYAQLSLKIYEAPYIRETKQLKATVESQDGFFSLAWQSILKGWQGISVFLIQILAIWPILIMLGIGVYVFKKWRNNKLKNQPSA